jgi:DNA-binding CsgD family transcriptional regulator
VPPDPAASTPDRSSDGSALLWQSQARVSFVGRQVELQQLKAAFAAAAAGNGRLMLLVGEPGIGKTALCDQLGSSVADSGGVPLVGHCYEEGSFRRPYQPFIEAFGTYVRESDTEILTADLGSSAADLARLVPGLSERLDLSPHPAGDPEEDRWRLLDAAVQLLRSAAAHRPLLLVLEDLHDADRGTLDLLLHVSRNLHSARLLVVGTYRDVEVDRAHPLSAALGELHRASSVGRLHVRGLSTEEVQRLLAEASQQTISQPFAELVHRQTDGNPLFVHQTLRFVIEEGLVAPRGGALLRVGEQSLAGRIPEGLRDAVGKRLSRLSDGTNRVLSVASVLGREFQLDVLRQVLACPEEELEASLEEASMAGIIEEHSAVGAAITYRFSHAFFRQTLYDEIVAPRRIRLHQQVARTLEEVYIRRLDEHADELAEHFSFYSDTLNLAKAVQYGEVAARHATEAFAYGEAARQLDRALVVLDLVDPDDQVRHCDLLLMLAEALFPAGETERVIARVAPDAFAFAEGLGDRGRAFRACRLALDCLYTRDGSRHAEQPEYRAWAERAIQYAAPDTIERSHADVALARVRYSQGQFAHTRALRLEALALARRHADPEALFSSAWQLLTGGAPQHWGERARLAEECPHWPRQGASGRTLGLALRGSALVQLAQGERARAEELWRQVEELAERTRVATVTRLVISRDAILAIVDGHLDDALSLIMRFVERADESGAPGLARGLGAQLLLAPALYLGRADVWLSTFSRWYTRPATPARPSRLGAFPIWSTAAQALCLARLGRLEDGRTLVGPLLGDIEQGSLDDEFPSGPLVILLQAAVVFEHRAATQALAARLAPVANLAAADYFYTCVARHLGDAAALAGDLATAQAYCTQALESAGKIRFRPELALLHLRLAEMADFEDDSARSDALEHLNSAIPELRDMHMQPALERGQILLRRLGHQAPSPATDAQAAHVLTGREREVARLVAAGRSNREIADTLVITEGTVEVHIKHVLSKLGFRSRTQVAAWVADQHFGKAVDVRS